MSLATDGNRRSGAAGAISRCLPISYLASPRLCHSGRSMRSSGVGADHGPGGIGAWQAGGLAALFGAGRAGRGRKLSDQ